MSSSRSTHLPTFNLLNDAQDSSVTSTSGFKRKFIATAVSLVIGTSLVSLNSYAADAADRDKNAKDKAVKLETVVVTSRNRAEAAQDVPLPVRVIGGERLDRDDIKSVWDLPSVAPNLQLNNPGENARKVSPGIRGLGRGGANDSMEQSVGTIVDGVTLYYSGQAWSEYVDLDRIEVLYGPQGTLVGKNTSLGAIKIATKLPSFKPSSSVEITAGELNTLQAKVSTTGPLIDDLLAYRGTFLVDRKDGLYDNTYLNFGKSRETWRETNKEAARIQFLLTPNEDFTGRFIFDKLRSDERTNTGNELVSNGPDTWADGTARAQTPPITTNTGYTVAGSNFATYGYLGKFAQRAAWFHNDDGSVYQPPVGTTDIENSEARPQITNQHGASAQFDWHVKDHSITSITAYRYQDFDIKNGGQFGKFYVSNSGQQLWNDQFSQELRIASDAEPNKFFDYQAGLYYLNAEVFSDDPSYYGPDAGAWLSKTAQFKTLVTGTPAERAVGRQLLRASLDGIYQSSVTDATVNSLAAYAQADFHLTEKATVSIGVRDTKETKKNKIATQLDRTGENLDNLGALYGATLTQITAAKTVRASQVLVAPYDFVEGNDIDDNLVAWNISPSYKLNDDINVYASVGKGMKSGFIYFGQYIAPVLTDPNFVSYIKPEETLDYELGIKSLLLNRTLQLNVNLYDTQVTDYQASWTRSDPINDGVFLTSWGNAPKVEAKGIELESNYRFNKELDFNVGAAYNEATYEAQWLVQVPEISATKYIDRNGEQIANVPKVVVNYGVNYQTPVAGYLGRITLQNTYKSGSYFNDNHAEFTYQDAYTLTNLSLALGSLNKKWEAQLNIRNVFDTEYAVRRTTFTSTAGQSIEVGAPRYASITLKYNL